MTTTYVPAHITWQPFHHKGHPPVTLWPGPGLTQPEEHHSVDKGQTTALGTIVVREVAERLGTYLASLLIDDAVGVLADSDQYPLRASVSLGVDKNQFGQEVTIREETTHLDEFVVSKGPRTGFCWHRCGHNGGNKERKATEENIVEQHVGRV
ncbi:hypothetical protein PV11_01698 [Exophiala sideris]|uniref:Uncharacterized protein n=1 Tax=Exophiala sideris TaxID=1016849 RepID=A0A0D1YX20_9EURO|nr:hypothetical protein PV11_01698 [Exophiala sideris]